MYDIRSYHKSNERLELKRNYLGITEVDYFYCSDFCNANVSSSMVYSVSHNIFVTVIGTITVASVLQSSAQFSRLKKKTLIFFPFNTNLTLTVRLLHEYSIVINSLNYLSMHGELKGLSLVNVQICNLASL